MINITLLGTGGRIPTPNRYLASMVIDYEGRKILIDCGEGTQVAMREFHTGFKAIDIICLTHYHGDHIFGLPGLLLSIGNSGRKEPLTIIGPIGLGKIIDSLSIVVPYLPYDLKLIEDPRENLGLNIDSDILKVGEEDGSKKYEITLSTLDLDHSLPCLGYSFYISRSPRFNLRKAIELNIPKKLWSRLQNNKKVEYEGKVYYPEIVMGKERKGIKISYITDTRPINAMVSFIRESDLLVCEGTYGDNADIEKAIENQHMTFKEAAKLASKGNVKELLLTHFSTAIDRPEEYITNATDVFTNTVLGYDGYKTVLTYEE